MSREEPKDYRRALAKRDRETLDSDAEMARKAAEAAKHPGGVRPAVAKVTDRPLEGFLGGAGEFFRLSDLPHIRNCQIAWDRRLDSDTRRIRVVYFLSGTSGRIVGETVLEYEQNTLLINNGEHWRVYRGKTGTTYETLQAAVYGERFASLSGN